MRSVLAAVVFGLVVARLARLAILSTAIVLKVSGDGGGIIGASALLLSSVQVAHSNTSPTDDGTKLLDDQQLHRIAKRAVTIAGKVLNWVKTVL